MNDELERDIKSNSYMCPSCHQATLYEHYMQEYKHDYNKCSSCGFMELKAETRKRLKCKLSGQCALECSTKCQLPADEKSS